MASLVSHQQFQLEIMNEDDFIGRSPYEVRTDIGHDSGDFLGVMVSGGEIDSTFHTPHERKTLIQSQQRVSSLELSHIPADRREEFIDRVKERALHGMVEQADLINAVSYEEEIDPIAHEKIIIAKLKVIIDEQ